MYSMIHTIDSGKQTETMIKTSLVAGPITVKEVNMGTRQDIQTTGQGHEIGTQGRGLEREDALDRDHVIVGLLPLEVSEDFHHLGHEIQRGQGRKIEKDQGREIEIEIGQSQKIEKVGHETKDLGRGIEEGGQSLETESKSHQDQHVDDRSPGVLTEIKANVKCPNEKTKILWVVLKAILHGNARRSRSNLWEM